MRLLLRAIAALPILVLCALVMAVVLAPRLITSDAVRQEIVDVVSSAIGRSVSYEELELQLVPLSVVFVNPSIAGDATSAGALLELETLELHIATRPLFERSVVIDSVVLEGATLRLVRTADGIAWPWRAEPEAAQAETPPGTDSEAAAGFFSLAVRELDIRRSTLVLRDEVVTPQQVWQLGDVKGTVSTESPTAAFDFDLAMTLASGGRVTARGMSSRDAIVDVIAELDDVSIDVLLPYFAPPDASDSERSSYSARATGSVTLNGPATAPHARAVLDLNDARLAFDAFEVVGPLDVTAEISGLPDEPRGTFSMDATSAQLRYGGAFEKPAGDRATIDGRFFPDGRGGLAVDDVHLKISDFEAHGSVGFRPRLRVELTAGPADFGVVSAVVSAFADYELSGRFAIETLTVLTDPLDLRGRIALDGATFPAGNRVPVQLDGSVVVESNRFHTNNLIATVAEQPFHIEADASDLWGSRKEHIHFRADGIDSNAMVAAITGKADRLHGSLTATGEVTGAIGDVMTSVESLNGELRFDITDGSIAGVSLLEASFGALGLLAPAARLTDFLTRRRDMQRHFGGEFDSLGGTLQIENGVIRTDDLRAAYPGYTVDLWGTLRLTDLSIDMKGNLTLGGDLLADLGAKSGTTRVIPLAAVRGTLNQPEVVVAETVVEGFLASLPIPGVGRLTGALEGLIRPGIERLGGLLGNRADRSSEKTDNP